MKGFKPFGQKMRSGFSFPTKAGFTSSSGKVREIAPYTQRVGKRKFADGGKIPGAGPISDKEARMMAKKPSPGVGGALRDFVSSVSQAVAPRALKERRAKVDKESGYADGGSVGNAVVKRGSPPIAEADKEYGGKGPLRTGYSKGGSMQKVAGKAISRHVAAPKPRGHGVKPGRSFGSTPMFGD